MIESYNLLSGKKIYFDYNDISKKKNIFLETWYDKFCNLFVFKEKKNIFLFIKKINSAKFSKVRKKNKTFIILLFLVLKQWQLWNFLLIMFFNRMDGLQEPKICKILTLWYNKHLLFNKLRKILDILNSDF